MGVTHDLSKGGYTFTTESGVFDSRFVLMAGADPTGIDYAKPQSETAVSMFSLAGVRTQGKQQAGVYIMKKNGVTTKVVVR